MLKEIQEMMRFQDEINTKVNVDWKNTNTPWYRAIWTECAEMIDHVGWKWWKKQEPDIFQVQLEVVDIWHFGLSDLIQNEIPPIDIEKEFSKKISDNNNVQELIELVASKTLAKKRFDLPSFVVLMNAVQFDFNLLYRFYIGKNALNRFRQDNGYKDGSYKKIWFGKEDNEWLADMVQNDVAEHDDFLNEIYSALQEKYFEVVKAS